MSISRKVALNTVVLYGRMLVTVLIALYTTRTVFNSLGVYSYGLFNLIAGITVLFGFLAVTLSTSTQRYLAFHMGQRLRHQVNEVLSNSILLHLVIGLVIVLGFETLGNYFLYFQFNITPNSRSAAVLIFQLCIVSTFFVTVTSPYDAILSAHENMTAIAFLSILESVLKLVVAVYISVYSGNKLFAYAWLITLVSVAVTAIKVGYCTRAYPECRMHFRRRYNPALIAELASFAGWNLFYAVCSILRNQGIIVLLNLFFGAVVNASYGIANQVNAQLVTLSLNMQRAISPQISKSEGAGDRGRMIRLSLFSGKLSFYLFTLIALPLFVHMPVVLSVWLKSVPQDGVLFCRLVLVVSSVQQLGGGINSGVLSIGRIRTFQLVVGLIQLLTLPVAYLLLKAGYPAGAVLLAYLGVETTVFLFRAVYFTRITALPFGELMIGSVLYPLLIAGVVFIVTGFFAGALVLSVFMNVVLSSAVSVLLYLFLIYQTGLTAAERANFKGLMAEAWSRISRR